MSIASNILNINNTLSPGSKLIAVSKFQPKESIMQAYLAGQKRFGENRVQEMCKKNEDLPSDIEWHFIGHLQRNKIKYIIPFVHLIQSVDSRSLLKEIDNEASKTGRIVPCLLQVHIACEENKFGFSPNDFRLFLQEGEWKNLANIQIKGLMGMATFTDDQELIREEFRQLKHCFDFAKREYFPEVEYFNELSMGMTDDYQIALQEGSTMVRIGTALFGSRNAE